MEAEVLKERYAPCEPIVLKDTKWLGLSETAKRQMFKRLSDKGILKRYMSGVYYFPEKEKTVSGDAVIQKMYLGDKMECYGYQTGCFLGEKIGVTKRKDRYLCIVTNRENSRGRFRIVGDKKIYIKKPYLELTKSNVDSATILDFIREWEKYSEQSEEETFQKIREYITKKKIDRQQLIKTAAFYPDKVSALLLKHKLI